ncbi:hypothetical protein VP01_532g1 [Puccinia sorghi]|uniref:Uncharacterized protein n=1 Tax=Puccinia sorghi TaxID=27349 RepID=A0A0L6UKX7_9BASI|nr:hypothetical protein VP01_532g1 [Puccinia sorghi]
MFGGCFGNGWWWMKREEKDSGRAASFIGALGEAEKFYLKLGLNQPTRVPSRQKLLTRPFVLGLIGWEILASRRVEVPNTSQAFTYALCARGANAGPPRRPCGAGMGQVNTSPSIQGPGARAREGHPQSRSARPRRCEARDACGASSTAVRELGMVRRGFPVSSLKSWLYFLRFSFLHSSFPFHFLTIRFDCFLCSSISCYLIFLRLFCAHHAMFIHTLPFHFISSSQVNNLPPLACRPPITVLLCSPARIWSSQARHSLFCVCSFVSHSSYLLTGSVMFGLCSHMYHAVIHQPVAFEWCEVLSTEVVRVITALMLLVSWNFKLLLIIGLLAWMTAPEGSVPSMNLISYRQTPKGLLCLWTHLLRSHWKGVLTWAMAQLLPPIPSPGYRVKLCFIFPIEERKRAALEESRIICTVILAVIEINYYIIKEVPESITKKNFRFFSSPDKKTKVKIHERDKTNQKAI